MSEKKAVLFVVPSRRNHEEEGRIILDDSTHRIQFETEMQQRGAMQEGVPIILLPVDKYNAQGDILREGFQQGNSFQSSREWKPIQSLNGTRVYPRVNQYGSIANDLVKMIEQAGGISEVTQADYLRSINWPTLVPPEYLKRKIDVVPFNQLLKNVSDYAIDDKVFVKRKIKHSNERGIHGIVINLDRLIESISIGFLPVMKVSSSTIATHDSVRMHKNEDMIISQPLPLTKDPDNIFNYEYRCFVANAHPAHCIRYPYGKEDMIPANVVTYLEKFTKKNRDTLPKHYVVDIGLLNDRTYAVIELNPIIASGGLNQEGMRKILKAIDYSHSQNILKNLFG
jgi:hypothetical protein